MKRIKSEQYFHVLPENLNCAQSVLKGFQKQCNISNTEIEEFRAWGGGRAESGVCGALFAAERILSQSGNHSIVEKFREKAGGILCSELKDINFSCAQYVQIADNLLEQELSQ